MQFRWRNYLLVFFIGALAYGCTGKKTTEDAGLKEEKKDVAQKEDSVETTGKWKEPKVSSVDPGKKYVATIKTSKGEIQVELFAEKAPLSVTNFKQLADGGFYRGLTFHRVEPNFVIQGGDPTGTGEGGPGYTLPAEISLPHVEGALAWARLPEKDPNTGMDLNPNRHSSGSQFYITLAPQPFLDGGYTVFGQTIQGMEVVKKIERGDRIENITVEAR